MFFCRFIYQSLFEKSFKRSTSTIFKILKSFKFRQIYIFCIHILINLFVIKQKIHLLKIKEHYNTTLNKH